MIFEPADWSHLLQTLLAKTRGGKVDWRRSQYGNSILSVHAVNRLMNRVPDYEASLGANHFSMGSTDGDGHGPYFMTITRSEPGREIEDTLESSVWGMNQGFMEAAATLNSLYDLVHDRARAQSDVAKFIIRDLDEL